MKRLFLLFLLIAGCSVFADEEPVVYSKVYATRFFHCFPTSNSYIQDGSGTNSRTGWWKDGKCRFATTSVDSNGEAKTYSCNFTRAQVTEFATAMKSDPSGTGETKTLLEKYKKDNQTCEEMH